MCEVIQTSGLFFVSECRPAGKDDKSSRASYQLALDEVGDPNLYEGQQIHNHSSVDVPCGEELLKGCASNRFHAEKQSRF